MAASDKLGDYFATGATITVGQVSEVISEFYSQPNHLWVPVHYALWAARMKLNGADAAGIEAFVAALSKAVTANTTR